MTQTANVVVDAGADAEVGLPPRRRSHVGVDLSAPKATLCSSWQWQLVKDYHPDPGVPWRAVGFAQNPLVRTYVDPVVEAEFLRFMCREFLAVAIVGTWGVADVPFSYMLGYPTSSFPAIIFFVASGCSLLVLLAVAYRHFVAPLSTNGAAITEKLTIMAVFCCMLPCSFQVAATPFYCERVVHPFRWMLGNPSDAISAARKQQFCLETISPYATVVSALAFVPIRLRPLSVFLVSTVFLSAIFAGYSPRVLPGRYEDSVIAQQMTFYIVAQAVAIVLVFIRDHLLRQQFEQAIATYARTLALEEQQRQVDHLLCAMLPQSVLPRLMAGHSVSDDTANATVMFSDVVSFTTWSAIRSATEVVHMLNYLCVRFDALSEVHKVEKVKTIGDAYWAVAGLPIPRDDHADVICLFALDCQKVVKSAARKHEKWADVKIRVGVHSGDLAGGTLGRQSMSYEVFGTTSHHAEQVEQVAEPGEVLVTAATRDELTEMLFVLVSRPPVRLHGREDPVATFAVMSNRRTHVRSNDDAFDGVSVASSCNTVSSVPSNGDEEEERLQRESFLRRTVLDARASQAIDEPAGPSVSVASAGAIAELVSRRKYRFIVLTFIDGAIEDQFVAFTLERQRALRFTARCCLFVVCAALVVLLLADTGSLPVSSAVIFSASLAACVALMVTSGRGILNRWLDFALFAAVCGGCFVGAGLVPRAVMSNDLTYLNPTMGAILAVGLPTIPTLAVVLAYVCVAGLPNITHSHVVGAVYSGVTISYCIGTFTLIFFAALLAERLARKQFVEHHVATVLQKGVARQRELQESLLAAIVPRHVVGDLMSWFRDGLDIEKSIAQPLEVAVAFLQMVHTVSPSLATASQRRSVPAVETMRMVRAVHDAADDELEKVKRHVAKIKTIGDIALLAGPFSRDVTLADAGRALVVAGIRLRRRVAPAVSIRCGYHVGSVVGAVVGTNRLCYDIFGDAVNTAARAMTAATADATDLIATGDFVHLFSNCATSGSRDDCRSLVEKDWSDVQYEFCDEKIVQLKGKGSVGVHVIQDVIVC